MEIFQTIGGLVSIVVGVVGTLALWKTYPKLACLSFVLIIIGILWFILRPLYRRYYRSFREIRKGISIIRDKLDKANYRPDLIIAFNRTGGVAAGMLAVNLRVKEVIVLNRRLRERRDTQETRFEVGSLVKLHSQQINSRRVLFMSMAIVSGNTLDVALAYLRQQGIQSEPVIASIYITPTTNQRLAKELGTDNIIYAYQTSEIREKYNRLPWLINGYDHD